MSANPDNVHNPTLSAMDPRRAVDGLLQRAEADEQLAPMVASVRDWAPAIAVIMAPGQRLEPGELPYQELAQLLDRITAHWQHAKAEAV